MVAMDFLHTRVAKTSCLILLAVLAINIGMVLGKFESGAGTALALTALICLTAVVGLVLFILIKPIWKNNAEAARMKVE